MEDFRTEAIPEHIASEERQNSSLLRLLFDVIETLVLAVLLFAGINAVSARIRVDGHSMEPTMHNGEYVLVSKLSYKLGNPKHGDVIVFHFPRDPNQKFIKRIIGLPGDVVKIGQGNVSVNGQPIAEPYIAAPPAYQNEWTVPEDSLFVLGDNRNNSSDSHSWGTVPEDYVVGKALLVYWPPDDWAVIKTPITAEVTP